MGEGEELGIVPRFTKELFERVEGTSDSKVCIHLPLPLSGKCCCSPNCYISSLVSISLFPEYI